MYTLYLLRCPHLLILIKRVLSSRIELGVSALLSNSTIYARWLFFYCDMHNPDTTFWSVWWTYWGVLLIHKLASTVNDDKDDDDENDKWWRICFYCLHKLPPAGWHSPICIQHPRPENNLYSGGNHADDDDDDNDACQKAIVRHIVHKIYVYLSCTKSQSEEQA